MRRLTLALTAVLCAVTASCGSERSLSGPGPSARAKVVAGFYPLAEAAARIGGPAVEIVNLTPAGTEPHDLELTSDQVDALEDADLVVYLGRGFQPAVEKIAERRRGAKLDVLEGLPLEKGSVAGEPAPGGGGRSEEAGEDPHFWLDPVLFLDVVHRIETALAMVKPGERSGLERNAESYRAELRAIDGEYRTTLSNCQRRDLVTSHAAFHYLARRYGLVQLPIAGLSPEAEPNPERLAEVMDVVRRRKVTTIFYETLVSPRVAQTLARDTGTRAAVLDPIEGLTEAKARTGTDYASVMRDNLQALKSALDC